MDIRGVGKTPGQEPSRRPEEKNSKNLEKLAKKVKRLANREFSKPIVVAEPMNKRTVETTAEKNPTHIYIEKVNEL